MSKRDKSRATTKTSIMQPTAGFALPNVNVRYAEDAAQQIQ
jgi:hypothetical protein